MRAGSAFGSAARHTLGMVAQAFLIVAIIATLVIGAASALGSGPAGADSVFAARGGQSGGNGNGHGNNQATVPSGTITVPDGAFGSVTNAAVTGGAAWVNVACQAETGGMVSWVTVDGAGLAAIQLGPTPSWSSGGASCSATAGSFDGSGNFNAAASATFTVY